MTWRHTPLYKVSQLTILIRVKNQTMRSKQLPAELRDRIVSRHRSAEGYKINDGVLKVLKQSMASINLKWKDFGTTRTLSRAGCLAKLSNWVRTLEREVRWPWTGSSFWLSYRGPMWRWQNLPEGQPSVWHSPDLGTVCRWRPLLSERHRKAHLKFAKRHLKDPQTRFFGLMKPWLNCYVLYIIYIHI